MRQKIFHKSERGQAIILIALAAVGLIAMVGLMVDGGMLLIEYGRLKRAIDAASLSAALQYREGYTIQELTDAAREFLILNQSDVDGIQVDTDATDATLLTSPRRKLVRVTATRHVRFGFLSIVGIYQTDITATSVGEAASVDVVIVLDASQSMAAEGGNFPNHYAVSDYATYGDPNRNDTAADDPSLCNQTNTCHPFREIKDVAVEFVNQLYFPYDRVAVVTFDRQGNLILPITATDGMTGTNAKNTVVAAINGLHVFQPIACTAPLDPTKTHCLNPSPVTGVAQFFEYPMYRASNLIDPSSITTSNIGDGLWVAGNEFGREPIRQDSLWVVILLAGGPTNTGCSNGATHNCTGPNYATGRICPQSTWGQPFCRGGDVSALTRHTAGTLDYDSDDYARDAADFIANPVTGQGATIFSIGLGELMRNAPVGDALAGEKLLNYSATIAGDESGVLVNHGLYFFAPDASQLREIFRTIAENIATRLSQ
jgi:Flp pilus assembly protein TadG